MIEYLRRVIESDNGEIQTSRPPNNTEIMMKINEIIYALNNDYEKKDKNPFKIGSR